MAAAGEDDCPTEAMVAAIVSSAATTDEEKRQELVELVRLAAPTQRRVAGVPLQRATAAQLAGAVRTMLPAVPADAYKAAEQRIVRAVRAGEPLADLVADARCAASRKAHGLVELGEGRVGLEHLHGLVWFPGALSVSEQEYWVRRVLRELVEPPNARSCDGAGEAVERRLWARHCSGDGEALGRVAWATLGVQYDWSRQTYPTLGDAGETGRFGAHATHRLCGDVAGWGVRAAAAAGFPAFVPEAGICNLYRSGKGRMGGHQDRSELTMLAPVVSMSLGCDGVFLVSAGPSRDAGPVVALRLRSGDVLVMGGASRGCFHGVACVLEGTCPDALFRGRGGVEVGDGCGASAALASASRRTGFVYEGVGDGCGARGEDAEEELFREWVVRHRGNVNLRQVLPTTRR